MKEAKWSVLVVDDAEQLLERVQTILDEAITVKSVSTAGNYSQAVQLLDAQYFDIALLDIRLPDKSGIELLELIKKRFPKIVVMMLTNRTERHYKKLCIELGATHFIDKSKEFEKLPGIIDGL